MYVHVNVHVYTWICTYSMYVHVGSSPTRGSSFFLGKVTALGVLCCFALFVCLTLLASFFLPSHLLFKNMYILGLVFGVIGGFITPAFSFILS